jgi:Na+-translocating ferredoxin:NAD+ oxidoreductase RnfG subunit
MIEIRSIVQVLLIALACAAALVITNALTEDRIASNQTAQLRAQLQVLIQDPKWIPDSLPDLSTSPASWLLCDGLLLARSQAAGYAGPIELLYTVSLAPPGLRKLTILRHSETPGITSFLQDGNGDAGWLASMANQTAGSVSSVDTVSGATISSRAIRDHLLRVLSAPATLLGEPVSLLSGCAQ